MAKSDAIKLVSECFIRPNHEGAKGSKKHQQPYRYLSLLDLTMLSIDNMQGGVLFNKPNNSNFVEKLKLTLSLTLLYFYPLAGQLVTERCEDDENFCYIFVDCNKGPGARFIHASALNISIMDVLAPNEDVPLFIKSFFDLGERSSNYNGHTRPLLSVQVTDLNDGVFMGVSMNHVVVDGTSLVHFLQVWSEVSMRIRSSNDDLIKQLVSLPLNLPIYERTLVPYGYGPTIKLPYLGPYGFNTTQNDEPPVVRERIFYFSSTSMAMLKAKANAKFSNISSFQALSALVWRSITRARNLPQEEETTCIFPSNIRPRFKPPLSNTYFGNYLATVSVASKVVDLLERDIGWVAMMIHQATEAVDDRIARDNFIRPYLEDDPTASIMNLWLPFRGRPNRVIINGSARFDLSGIEFGLGRPIASRNGYANRGDGVVLATAGCKGGESVELTIRLLPHRMDALLSDKEFITSVNFSSKL